MPNMENKIWENVYYSRFIASWVNETAGKYNRLNERPAFIAWLKSFTVNDKKMPDDVIKEICDLKYNGKFEFEELARRFKYEG